MSRKVRDIRDISPILQKLRDFLLGRKHLTALRFEDEVATRSPPLPNLPDGVAHKIHNNYYYTRDGRREVSPPEVIAKGQKLLQDPKGSGTGKRCTPGKVFHWD